MPVKKLLKLSEAEAKLKGAIASFGGDAVAYLTATDVEKGPPPLMAIRATAGLGKTHSVIKELLSYNLLEHGDVHYFVPNHKLSQQLVDDLNDELTLAIPRMTPFSSAPESLLAGRRKTRLGSLCAPSISSLVGLLPPARKCAHRCVKAIKVSVSFSSGCGYLEQLDEVDSLPKDEMFKVLTEVKVMTHEHMFLGTQSRFMQPD